MDHVRIYPDRDWEWVFLVESDAGVPTEEVEEVEDLCRVLYENFGEFVLPRRVEVTRSYHSGGQTIASICEDPDQRIDFDTRTLEERRGVGWEELLEALWPDTDLDWYVPRLAVSSTSARVRLASGDEYASRDSHCVEYSGGEPLDRPSRYDPLSLQVMHSPNVSDDDVDADYLYDVRVKTKSDVWFEDSERGETNARRLSSFLQGISTALPAVDVERITNQTGGEDEMETIF